MPIRRGDVIIASLPDSKHSETRGSRPYVVLKHVEQEAVVIQNDTGNDHSPNTIIAAIVAIKATKELYPIQVPIPREEGGLDQASMVDCGHIHTVSQLRLTSQLGRLSDVTMLKVDQALRI